MRRFVLILGLTAAGLSVLGASPGLPAGSSAAPKASSATAPKKEIFAGKVVLLPEALARRGVEAYDEMKAQVVLETEDGEIIPIVSDWRGRAFFQDKRLRDRKVELVGYRPQGTPYLKVLMVFTFDKQGVRQYTDYWCEICSIPMYEIKPCDCCHGPCELRFQPRDLPEYAKRAERTAERGKPNARSTKSQ